MTDCVFCQIAKGKAPATVVREWPDAIAFLPRDGGCTKGHILVIPRVHVPHFATNPEVSATTARRTAELAGELDAFNIITSCGEAATQTVHHLHMHIVPRRKRDGLRLPWS